MMILSAFFFNPQGDHRLSWRHPDAPGRRDLWSPYYARLAQVAEAARMDALFIADHVAMWDTYPSNVVHYANARLEPISLLAALAAVTHHIGLIVTASASYWEPYNLARTFASLDHLSNGRTGWNVVTSGMDEEAMNFGHDASIDHADRYERAAEFLDLTKALWDSIEDDALLLDKAPPVRGPSGVHRVDHLGKYFRVRGPLNVPRPPQGYPVIVQAGSSEDGKNLAAAYADLHFARARTIEEGQRYRKDFDARLRRAGRQSGELRGPPPAFCQLWRNPAPRRRRNETSWRRWYRRSSGLTWFQAGVAWICRRVQLTVRCHRYLRYRRMTGSEATWRGSRPSQERS